jgi:hypothetical protein
LHAPFFFPFPARRHDDKPNKGDKGDNSYGNKYDDFGHNGDHTYDNKGDSYDNHYDDNYQNNYDSLSDGDFLDWVLGGGKKPQPRKKEHNNGYDRCATYSAAGSTACSAGCSTASGTACSAAWWYIWQSGLRYSLAVRHGSGHAGFLACAATF